MLTDEVDKVQSTSAGVKDPSLRDDPDVAKVNYLDVIRTLSLEDQPLWPLEYNSDTTLEHLHNQVSSYVFYAMCESYAFIILCILSSVNLNVYNFCIQSLMLK